MSAADLPREVRREIAGLSPGSRDAVGAHLAAAARAVDDDPELAYRHAAFARQVASRLSSVREAVGVAAYRTGRWSEAARELAAYERMTGDPMHLALRADCERGLGRPERALTLCADPSAASLDRAARVELRIVEAGARRDLGQHAAAALALRGPDLDTNSRATWVARLRYAYADASLAAGDRAAAVRWFRLAADVDEDELTDAQERASALESGPTDG